MNNKVQGIIAEFKNPAELLSAAEHLRESDYTKFDCHSPFPIHGMDDAMGEKRSPLGWIVGIVAFCGFSAGLSGKYPGSWAGAGFFEWYPGNPPF